MAIGVDLGRNVPIQDDPGYNSAYFSGPIRKNGIGTLLIFKSGKVNVTGVRSVEPAKRAVEKEFPECEFKAMRITNVKFSPTLPGKIDQSESNEKRH
jgi:TATA-box binding protein (TBP) (component of TFIID and TFIIIB)